MIDNAPIPDEIKEVYDLECCKCHQTFGVNPSMMMTAFGINSGHGRCLNEDCKASLHLWIEDGVMKSELHDDYVNRIKESQK